MNQTYTREELEQLGHAELKKLAAELEMEGAQIKNTRHYFIAEFWRRIENRPVKVAELGEGKLAAARLGDQPIVFAKVDDKIYAFNDRCPHKGGPLADGIVHGRKVACPLHNWIINLEDGEATGADKGCARSFPVKIENGRVYLDMNVAAKA